MGYIYLTTNLINNKKYIGMSTRDDERYLGSGKLIKRALDKYGKSNFRKEILEYEEDFEKLCELEKYYIEKYDAVNRNDFYNIHEGGNGGNTIKGYSEEEKEVYKQNMSSILKSLYNDNKELREKVSQSVKEAFDKNNSREKISKSLIEKYKTDSNYRKRVSEGTKVALAKEDIKQRHIEGNKRAWENEERRKLTSERYKGSGNPNYGNKISEENKKKMEIARTEKVKKSVAAYFENGDLFKVFDKKKDAKEFLGIKAHIQLNNAIKNNTMYKGYYWKEI